jgi:RHS repeat-associated protein
MNSSIMQTSISSNRAISRAMSGPDDISSRISFQCVGRMADWHEGNGKPGTLGDDRYWMGSLAVGMRDAMGQMYMRNRYYDPQTGQFTQPDSIGLAGGLNSYGFAAGDPVSYSDPYGLKVCFKGSTSEVGALKSRSTTCGAGAWACARSPPNNRDKLWRAVSPAVVVVPTRASYRHSNPADDKPCTDARPALVAHHRRLYASGRRSMDRAGFNRGSRCVWDRENSRRTSGRSVWRTARVRV